MTDQGQQSKLTLVRIPCSNDDEPLSDAFMTGWSVTSGYGGGLLLLLLLDVAPPCCCATACVVIFNAEIMLLLLLYNCRSAGVIFANCAKISLNGALELIADGALELLCDESALDGREFCSNSCKN